MKKFFKSRLQLSKGEKRFYIILLVILVIAFIATRYLTKWEEKSLESATTRRGTAIAHIIQCSIELSAENSDLQLTRVLDRVFNNPSILYIVAFKQPGKTSLYRRSHVARPIPGADINSPDTTRTIEWTQKFKVLEIKSQMVSPGDTRYTLFFGFDYSYFSNPHNPLLRNFHKKVFAFLLFVITIIVIIKRFDKKVMQKELELQKEKQEKERFKELSLLTSEIAHEIKNPLNSIFLSFKTLEKHITIVPGKEEKMSFYSKAIKDEIKRVSDIIRTYSELAKRVTPCFETLDISSFAAEFRFLVEKELSGSEIRLDVDAPVNKSFCTDPNFLKQILFNLVRNAAEAGADIIRTGFSFLNNKRLCIIVSDNGKGISEDVKKKIFKPYFSTKAKGMGLGLHITLRLVRSLGGELQLVSSTPGDTIFQVTLEEGATNE